MADISKIKLPNGDLYNLKDENAIHTPENISTGDIIYYSNNSIPQRLEIGNYGQVLKVDSNGLPQWETQNVAEYKTLTNQEIATFDDGIQNSTLKSYSVKIEPKQDLHGYDKPWVGGSGKNLIDIPDYALAKPSARTISRQLQYLLPAGNYICSGNRAGTARKARLTFRDANNVKVGEVNLLPYIGGRFSSNVTISADVVAIYTYIEEGDDDGVTAEISNVMLTSANEEDQTYEPYSNICQIEGYNTINMIRTGKNLCLNDNYVDGTIASVQCTIQSNGSIKCKGTSTSTSAVKALCSKLILPNGIYKLSGGNSDMRIRCNRYNVNDELIDRIAENGTGAEVTIDDTVSYIYLGIASGQTTTQMDTTIYPQLESGSIATSYSPYTGQTVNVQFPAEVGTVYGGTVTVNEDGSGTVIVDKVSYTFDGTESWTMVGEDTDAPFFRAAKDTENLRYLLPKNGTSNNANTFSACSLFTQGIVSDSYPSPYKYYIYKSASNDYPYIQVRPSYDIINSNTASDLSVWENWLSSMSQEGTPLQIVYEIETPISYSLTSTQLKILMGKNHIWADAGNITITYPTNLKGYIDSININLDNNYVKYTDYATANNPGIIKIANDYGLRMDENNNAIINKATVALIKDGSNNYKPIVPATQHASVFYGLSKAAGDTTQSTSNNTVGTYTDEAIAAILHMLKIDAIIGDYELDEIADKNYSVNQLFMMKGKLYRATSFIPQGGTITPNSNCIQTSLINGFINADQEAY